MVEIERILEVTLGTEPKLVGNLQFETVDAKVSIVRFTVTVCWRKV